MMTGELHVNAHLYCIFYAQSEFFFTSSIKAFDSASPLLRLLRSTKSGEVHTAQVILFLLCCKNNSFFGKILLERSRC